MVREFYAISFAVFAVVGLLRTVLVSLEGRKLRRFGRGRATGRR